MNTVRTALLLAVLSPVSAGALAANNSTDDNAGGDLEQVVVSATRTEQPLDKTGSSISVITGAQLETSQTAVISDALAQTPGLAVARAGGPGQATSLYIRGSEPGESLVLIDGIRINDPSTVDNQAVLGDLLTNDIDRIEVLRGPQSTLYGSNAIGGVVDILTKRGGANNLTASAEGGSYDTYRLNAAANGSTSGFDYGAAVNYYDTRGVSAADEANGNTEPDGDRSLSATANTRLHLSDTLSLDLRGIYIRTRTDFDGYYPPPDYIVHDDGEYDKDVLRAGYAALNFDLPDVHLHQRLALIGSDSERRYYGQWDYSNDYLPGLVDYDQGGSTRIEYQGIYDIDKADQLTFGFEHELDTIEANSFYYGYPITAADTGRDRVTSYYGQWQGTLADAVTLTGGIRDDIDDAFGSHVTGRVAAAWQLPDGSTILRGNWGGGFKAPTLYQLYSPYANPVTTLRPETSSGEEIGVDQLFFEKSLRASLTYFKRTQHNAIDFDDCYGSGVDAGCEAQIASLGYANGYYYNVGRSESHGYEAEVDAKAGSTLDLWANYTNLVSIDELTGLQLARRPHISANAGITWAPSGGSSLGGSIGYLDRRYDNAANTVDLHSFTTVNLFATYALTKQLSVYGRVENLFNELHEQTSGYGVLGRGFYAGVRASL